MKEKIMATYVAQASQSNGDVMNTGHEQDFDVTGVVLRMSADEIRDLEDDQDESDQLVWSAGTPWMMHQSGSNPYAVRVSGNLDEFFLDRGLDRQELTDEQVAALRVELVADTPTRYAVLPLSGEDAPDTLVRFTFDAESLLNLRSARKLVLDHSLLQIHISPTEYAPGEAVRLAANVDTQDDPELNEELASLMEAAADSGLPNAPRDFALAFDADNRDRYGSGIEPVAVVVTPTYLWMEFTYRNGDQTFTTRPLDLDELLGAPDDDNQ